MLYCPSCGSEEMVKSGYSSNHKQRYKCKVCEMKTVSPVGLDHIDNTFDRKVVSTHMNGKTERYVITAAQNATPVNKPFLESLLRYCEEQSAKLLVIPYRYRNPTSMFADKDYDWWDASVLPYIADTRFHITTNLQLMGDIKIQPTAAKPLSGMDSMTGLESAIFGHPKVQQKTIATRPGEMAKILITTGAVTIPNYTSSKAGKKGQHHHTYSAAVVEKSAMSFHLRHVTACNDGSFIDLEREYFPDRSRRADDALALVLGDLHLMFLDRDVENAVFGKGGIFDTVVPKELVFHDIVDSYSVSHHHRKDPFIKNVKSRLGVDSVKREIDQVISYLREKACLAEVNVVSSNHHNHIRQWIMETDWRNDPVNAEFYLETALYMLQNSVMGPGGVETPDPFKYWVTKELQGIVNFIDERHGKSAGKFELGLHGHAGPNGSRGSLNNLSKIGSKVIIGHSHSPGREDGSLCVGTSSRLDLEYARSGPSSWMQTHAVVYSNGKATLINVIDGKWRR
jgi:hypothetical protein